MHEQSVVAFDDVPALRVNLVRLRLDQPLAPGAATTIELDYDGAGRPTGVLFPEDSAGARRVFDALEATKALYTEWFGPLHGPQGFAVISVARKFGAQADVTAIIQTADAFDDVGGLESLYHEVSHLWNARPRDELPPRWEEGLATYLQYRVAELRDGSPPVAERARTLSRRVRSQVELNPRLGEVPMIDYGRHRLTGASYTVGTLLFAALEDRLGRPGLDRIVGEYFQRYRATGATTRDLARLASELSAGASDEVFDVWLLTTRWVDEMEDWFPSI